MQGELVRSQNDAAKVMQRSRVVAMPLAARSLPMNSRICLIAIATLLLAAYLGSYLWLSRRGYVEADRANLRGFYYCVPDNTDAWRMKNAACVILFWPLNVMDRSLGHGRGPAAEPQSGLE